MKTDPTPLDESDDEFHPIDAFGRRIRLDSKVIFDSLTDDSLVQGVITKISVLATYTHLGVAGKSWRLTIMNWYNKKQYDRKLGKYVDLGRRKKSRNMERPSRCMVLESQDEFKYSQERTPDPAA